MNLNYGEQKVRYNYSPGYKITKRVQALLIGQVAWEYVNAVVTSRCFAVHMLLNHASTNVFEMKIRQVHFTYIISSTVEDWEIFKNIPYHYFSLLLTLKPENSVSWRASLCNTGNDYAYNNHFATGKISLFVVCHKPRGLLFFSGKLFNISNRILFDIECIARLWTFESWENSRYRKWPNKRLWRLSLIVGSKRGRFIDQ